MRLLQVFDQIPGRCALLVFLRSRIIEAFRAVDMAFVDDFAVHLQIAKVLPDAAGRFLPVILNDRVVVQLEFHDAVPAVDNFIFHFRKSDVYI